MSEILDMQDTKTANGEVHTEGAGSNFSLRWCGKNSLVSLVVC